MRIHKTILSQLKYALVWGSSVKHMPQKVGKDHVLKDEDIVQIVKKYFFVNDIFIYCSSHGF